MVAIAKKSLWVLSMMALMASGAQAASSLQNVALTDLSLEDSFHQTIRQLADANDAQQAQALFKVYQQLHPNSAMTFDQFFKNEYPQFLAKAAANGNPKPTQVPTQKPTDKPTQKPTDKPTQKPTQVPPVTSKSDAVTAAKDLSFYNEIRLPAKADKIDLLNQKNSNNNMQTVVQSSKAPSSRKSNPADNFSGPEFIPDPSGPSRRRLADGSIVAGSLMFCDVSGNAVWNVAVGQNNPAPTSQSVTTTIVPPELTGKNSNDGFCSAGPVKVEVSSFQAGCSRQNNKNGCSDVYYKGCGGMAVDPITKKIVVARTGGRSIGLMNFAHVGNTCQGRTIDVITTFKGKKFNSPTDVAFSDKGNLYFTDSPFGLATSAADFEGDTLDKSKQKEIPFNGVYLLRRDGVEVELLDCDMTRPNKIAFSPKQDLMYVTNSQKGNSYINTYKLKEDGTVGDSHVFFNFTAYPELDTADGYVEGIRVDDQGNVYAACHTGVFVFTPEAELIGNVRSTQPLSGLTFGHGQMFVSGNWGVAGQSLNTIASQITPASQTVCDI